MPLISATVCETTGESLVVVDDDGVRRVVPADADVQVRHVVPGQRVVARTDDTGRIAALTIGAAPA